MVRVSIFLVVLIVASSPAANALCVMSCGQQPVRASHCLGGETPTFSSVQEKCPDLSQSPFLREDLRPAVPVPPVLPPSKLPEVPDAALTRSLVSIDLAVTSARAKPLAVLRL